MDDAWAYSIHSGLTDGCHERISRSALQQALPSFAPGGLVALPTSRAWTRLADGIQRDTARDDTHAVFSKFSEDSFRLLFVSLVIGVRSPDTEGHAVTNLTRLREIHADPSPEGQYAHALRGPKDDGALGDEIAVQGTREAILNLIEALGESLDQKTPEEQFIKVQLYFDFYGLVDIEVWEPAYLLGRALHALQDSFAHTVRSDDLKRIRHVFNFVDAIAGDLAESVDGLAHSAMMDRCDGATAAIAEAATLASTHLIEAVNQTRKFGNIGALQAFLDEWLTYEPGCTVENEYCDSIWIEVARQEPTGPYLESLTGCATSTDQAPPTLVLILFLLCWINHRRRHQLPMAVFVIIWWV